MMDVLASSRVKGSHHRTSVVALAAFLALLLVIVAPPALGASYRVVGWGFNGAGALGTGSFKSSTKPVQAGELLGVSAVVASQSNSAALLDNGEVLQWGYLGETTKGSGEPQVSATPLVVEGLSDVTAIAPGLALLSDGTVMTWGGYEAPMPVSGITTATAVAKGGDGTSAALLSDGTVRAWGPNSHGELGDGLTEGSSTPVEVCAVGTEGPCPHGPYLGGVTAVSVGEYYVLALLENGTVAAWGYDADGELGGGTGSPFIPNPNPELIGSLTGVKAISAGATHGDALMSDGTVEEWGWNGSLPAPVSGLSGVKAISAGSSFSMALLADGTVRTWGNNKYGQLGDGTHIASSTPVAVGNLTGVASISAGTYTALTVATALAPAIRKLSIRTGSASGGTAVTVTGTNLNGATAVEFGGTSAASYTVNSQSSISAVTPEHAPGLADVTITTPSGTSVIKTADRFRFTPTVTDVSPSIGPAAGGTTVTITGAGFVPGTTATKFTFGKVKAKSVDCTSTTECTVASPTHEVAVVDVTATVSKTVSPQNPPADRFIYE